MEQVREAVGVTLCVLCSNLQLHRKFVGSYSDQKGSSNIDDEWSQVLLDQATERAIRIQKTAYFDCMDADKDLVPENGVTNDSEDVKWMETVMYLSLQKVIE